jgi:signal transduction histidine kinase
VTARARVRGLRAAVVTGTVLAVAGTIVTWVAGEPAFWIAQGGPPVLGVVGFFGALVWLVAPRQPHNRLLTLIATSVLLFGLFGANTGLVASVIDPAILQDGTVAPADLDPAVAWVLSYSDIGWMPALMILLTLGLLLFPDGRLPSTRWRPLPVYSVVVIAMGTITGLWDYRPASTLPYRRELSGNDAIAVGAVMLAVVLSLAGLISRMRASRGETRQQFKWVMWGASCLLVTLSTAIFLESTVYQVAAETFLYIGFAVFIASYAVAVGKYRLYDVDVVISRTFVYGTLAVFITGFYVVAVLWVGRLLGGDTRSNRSAAIAVTAMVAFAFEPLRGRLQRLANRIVYGRRATPYEVLSDFTQRIGADDTELLQQVARSLVEGTTAIAASVWLVSGDSLTRVAEWPEDWSGGAPGHGPSAHDLTRDVVHQGQRLGVLAVTPGRGQPILATDEKLLEQVASVMGLALRNLRLDGDLHRQVEALSRSRQRLLAVEDETRRQLERELHAGPQQRLVALKVKLAMERDRAEASGHSDLMTLLDQISADTTRTVESLRDFARGVYPPLLEAEGLRAALTAQTQRFALPVTVHAAGVGRFFPELEAAVYFCILEALQNVAKHAQATSAHVVIREDEELLVFEVSDDGHGFDVDRLERGSGLANLRDRLAAIDGRVVVRSQPGQGTSIRGRVPTRTPELTR